MVSVVVVVTLIVAGDVAASEDDGDADDITIITGAPALDERASESRMDRSAIDSVRAESAQDLLRSLPGIQLSQHGSEGKAAQFFLRGFDASHGTDVALSVDGMPLNEPSHIHGHGYADSGLVIPEAISAIRFRKGVFGLDQGNLATAGDISYQLGVPEPWRGTEAGVESGWPARGRLWGYVAPEGGAEEDVLAAELVFDQGAYENRETRRGGLIGQQTVGDWRIRGAIQSAEFGLPGALEAASIQSGDFDRSHSHSPETGGEQRQLWLGGVRDASTGDWSHRTAVDIRARQFDATENFTGYLTDDEVGDDRREFQRSAMGIVDHRTRFDVAPDWNAVVYGGVQLDILRQFEDAVDGSGNALSRNRGGTGYQGNTWVAPGVEAFVGDGFDIEAGVRLEAMGFDYRDDEALGGERGRDLLGIVAPRATGRWYVGDDWTMTVGVGRGFRGPEARVFAGELDDVDDVGLDGAAAEPTVTTVDGSEVGVIVEPGRNLKVSATAFGYFSGSEYVYDHVSRSHVDLGATRRLGAEVDTHLHIGEHLALRGHLSAVDGRFTDSGDAIPFVPPIEAGLSAVGRWSSGLFGGAQWRGISGRPLPFGARAGGWSLVDAHIGWRLRGWQFRLDIANVFDAQWNEGAYHYASHFDRSEPRTGLPSTHVVPGHPRLFRVQVSHRW